MLKNSEKSPKYPYYLRNKNLGLWMPESLHNWFTEYSTNTAMEAAFQKAEITCFGWSLSFYDKVVGTHAAGRT